MSPSIPFLSAAPRAFSLITFCAVLTLAACGPAPAPQGINDPHETENRAMHQFNIAVDRTVLKPVAEALGAGNGPISTGIGNFADNLGTPGDVVNNVLQLRLGRATHNTLRFTLNTVAGLGGIFDPATALGVPAKETDFGETLHVWGVGEGAYMELPLFGPSTRRDALGTVVDVVLDPLNYVIPTPESYVGTAAKVASKVGDRGRYSETIDSILYESADSYLQARLLYLQNRRYELGQTTGETADFEDPYEDPYGQ